MTDTQTEPTHEPEVDVTELFTVIAFDGGVATIERPGHANADTVQRDVLAVAGSFGNRPEVSVDADRQTGTITADLTDADGKPAGRGVVVEFTWRYRP